MYTIYKYTNSQNGKVYIGQTCTSLEKRAGANGANYSQCRRFYNAIKKYSWDCFVPDVLCTVDTQDEANEMEEYYIGLYNSTDDTVGYNIANGGNNHSMPDESKNIISNKAKKRYSDKTKNPMYGRKHSESTKKKQSECKVGENNPMFGTKWNDTQRKLCGVSGKKLSISDEQRKRLSDNCREMGKTVGLKPVFCIEDSLEFPSIKSAADYYCVDKSTLGQHLHGRYKTCVGKHFVFV